MIPVIIGGSRLYLYLRYSIGSSYRSQLQTPVFLLYHCAEVEVYCPQEIKGYFRIILRSGWHYVKIRFNSQKKQDAEGNTQRFMLMKGRKSLSLATQKTEHSCSQNTGQQRLLKQC